MLESPRELTEQDKSNLWTGILILLKKCHDAPQPRLWAQRESVGDVSGRKKGLAQDEWFIVIEVE